MGTCYADGAPVPINIVVAPPEHLQLTDKTDIGGAQIIDMDELVSHEYRMEQFTMHFSSVPTTAEDVQLIKDSVLGPGWDTVLLTIDPATEGLQNIVCLNHFMFVPGDRVRLDFANTDDLGIGAEILLIRVD